MNKNRPSRQLNLQYAVQFDVILTNICADSSCEQNENPLQYQVFFYHLFLNMFFACKVRMNEHELRHELRHAVCLDNKFTAFIKISIQN